ncbi:MAG TPA: hypothetical protein VEU33_04880 [Archangium sp.]|nr:hypothetical protein [Archangium sp.]
MGAYAGTAPNDIVSHFVYEAQNGCWKAMGAGQSRPCRFLMVEVEGPERPAPGPLDFFSHGALGV